MAPWTRALLPCSEQSDNVVIRRQDEEDAVARPPIVDDLYTRRLETRDLERSYVQECEVLGSDPPTLEHRC